MRSTTCIAVLVMIFAIAWSPVAAQDASALNGAWVVTGWSNADGEANPSPQRGLYIFVVTREDGGNYSLMWVPGSEPRAEFANQQEPTDQEKLSAYDSFIANSGRLIVEGDQITFDAYMAKNPNYMAAFGESLVVVTWKIEGGTLTLEYATSGNTVTLRKPM